MTHPLILIQSRLSSTRFPRKVTQQIDHRTMGQVVYDRAHQTGLRVYEAAAEAWPEIPEQDVLSRFISVLHLLDPRKDRYDPIIRCTADTPLLDPGLVLAVLAVFRQENRYASSTLACDLVSTSPAWDGLDVEVISRKGLARAHALATEPRDREHVTPWLKRNGRWKEVPLEGTTLRWSVDDPAGLEFVRRVFQACEHCAAGVPRHTNAGSSIGGSDRHLVFDLHHLERGDLVECTAYNILKERMGGAVYVSR